MTTNETGCELPEYRDNPFIACLPPLETAADIYRRLRQPPSFDEKERQYPDHIRQHCIFRLARYFEPLEGHFELARKFDAVLRQGYIGRNPRTHGFIQHVQDGAERIEAKDRAYIGRPIQNTASSFSIVGCSGIGKSRAIETIMAGYPQIVRHSEPFSIHQLVWLKLDCPRQGSVKQLCQNFFLAVDQLLGTHYHTTHGRERIGVDHMVLHMGQVARTHALGVLVIDEIQHLLRARGTDAEGLLNFLVELVNTIAIPVIVIGTLAAAKVLQGNFREARRASGMGSLVWERLPRSGSWEHFVARMWTNQWLREFTPLSAGLMDVLYDESQGIVDIVVKLYMLSQLRAIELASARRKSEVLTPQLLRNVARKDFQLIQPMLQALRQGDRKALERYDDLLPLQQHVEGVFTAALGAQARPIPPMPATEPAPAKEQPAGIEGKVRSALLALGMASDLSEVLIREAIANTPSADPFQIVGWIADRLRAAPPAVKKPGPPKVRTRSEPAPVLDREDLRALARTRHEGQSAHATLLAAWIVKPPLEDIAA